MFFSGKSSHNFHVTQDDLNAKHGPILESDLFALSRPLLWIQFIVGRTPYYVKSGWMVTSLKSMGFLYACCLYAIHLALYVYSIFENDTVRQWRQTRDGIRFDLILYSLLIHVQTPILAFYIYSWVVEVPQLARMYNEMAVLEKKIRQIFPVCKLTRRNKTIMLSVIICYYITTTGIYALLIGFQYKNTSAVHLVTFAINFVVKSTFVTIWSLVFFCIKKLSSSVRETMAESVKNGITSAQLSICRQLWISLRNISQTAANCLSIVISFGLLSSCVVFITSIYGIIYSLNERCEFLDIIKILPYTVSSFGHIVMILETANQSTVELGDYYINYLIGLEKETMTEEMSTEVDRFIKTIQSLTPDVSMRGYYIINRKLLVSIISHAVTYLVVLLQFGYVQTKN